MEKLTIDYIKDWCNKNGYSLVKHEQKPLDFKTVMKIAEDACKVEKGDLKIKKRTGSLPFGRYLVVTYFYNYYPPKVILQKLEMHHTIISYAIKQNLFNENEIKYLKKWQQNALRYFIENIRLAGGVIKETKLNKLK